jgi:hypothetical protein
MRGREGRAEREIKSAENGGNNVQGRRGGGDEIKKAAYVLQHARITIITATNE